MEGLVLPLRGLVVRYFSLSWCCTFFIAGRVHENLSGLCECCFSKHEPLLIRVQHVLSPRCEVGIKMKVLHTLYSRHQ